MPEPTIWFNAACSKCRTAHSLLVERHVEASYVDYLRDAPTTTELRRVLSLLGTGDPRAIARTIEPRWAELHLDDASDDEVLEALAGNPILIERPIVILGERAVIARPPERVLDLLSSYESSAAPPDEASERS